MKILMQFSVRSVYAYILIIAVHVSAMAQTYNTGNAYISGNVYIKASFTNASTAVYQNDGNLSIGGNFNNNQASMAEGLGTTQFIGTSQQSLNGNQTPVFHDVVVNNTNGVLMNLNTTMGGVISPITGSLFFNGYALTMGGKINTAYTNTSAFNVTPTSDLFITGNASAGNGLYFASSANTIHNVTVSSGATGTLGNSLNITPGTAFGTVIVDGSFNAAGFLTLKSDSAGTARVGQSAGTVTNNVTVERYIPPRRAWRFFCAPVNNDTLHIRTAWQEGVNNPTLYTRYNPNPGYGTHITGDNYSISSGYDFNTTFNPSLRTWNQSANTWNPYTPPTAYTLVNDYDAYYFFIRGSRAVDLAQATSAIPDPTIIRTTGKLNNNIWSKTYTGLVINNWLLLPNPYASSINIASVLSTSTGIYSNKFWVFDPKLSGVYGVGGYVVYDNGIMVPPSPSYPSPTTIIQGEQAFFVQVNATTASFSYKQNDKTPSETNVFGFGKSQDAIVTAPPAIYTNLFLSGENAITDGIAVGFGDNFSDSVDGDDAEKRYGYNENIAFIRHNKALAIEFRPFPKLTDTLFLKSYLRQIPYTFQIYTQNFEGMPLIRAWLVDKYTNTKTELNLHDTVTYSFIPNADIKSSLDRFMIVFNRQLITNPIPVSKTTNKKDPNISGAANNIASTSRSVNISPNPVTNLKNARLQFNNMVQGNYEITIYSSKGQILSVQKLVHNGSNTAYSLAASASLASGVYRIIVLNEDSKQSLNLNLMINR